MDLSICDHTTFPCIHCGKASPYIVHRVLDAIARPYLVQALIDDWLHRYQCQYCSAIQTVGTMTLILRRQDWPHVLVVPNPCPSISGEVQERELNRLIQRLMALAGTAWRPEWRANAVLASREIVRIAATRNVDADLATGFVALAEHTPDEETLYNSWLSDIAAEHTDNVIRRALVGLSNASGPAARAQFIEAHPILLGDAATEVIEGITSLAENSQLPAAASLRGIKELLNDCRLLGVEAAYRNRWDALVDSQHPAVVATLVKLHYNPSATGSPPDEIAVLDAVLLASEAAGNRMQLCDLLLHRGERLVLRGRQRAPADIEEAISSLRAAVELLDGGDLDSQRIALAHKWLGIAYRARADANPLADAHAASEAFSASRDAAADAGDRLTWIVSTNGLANSLLDRARLDRPDLLEEAIRLFEELLASVTPGEEARLRATVLGNLGLAYNERRSIKRADDVELALGYLKAAQAIPERQLDLQDWAVGEANLGFAYYHRLNGDPEDNLAHAVQHLVQALAVCEQNGWRDAWAVFAPGLANVLARRRAGDADADRARAVALFEQALKHFDPDVNPYAWAGVANDFANLLSDGRGASPESDLRRAVDLHRLAFERRERSAMPQSWAQSAHNLAGELLSLVKLDHCSAGRFPDQSGEALLLEAEERLADAMQVRTRNQAPFDWADSAETLAKVLSVPRYDDGQEDSPHSRRCKRAVDLFREALKVHQDADYLGARRVASLLGDLLADLGRWQEASDVYAQALDASDVTYAAGLLDDVRSDEIAYASRLYARAAYAAARIGEATRAVCILERGRARRLGERLERDRANLDRIGGESQRMHEAYLMAVNDCRSVEALARQLSDMPPEDRVALRPHVAHKARAAQEALREAVGAIRALPGHGSFLALDNGATSLVRALTAASVDALAYMVATKHGSVVLLVVGNALDTTQPQGEGSTSVADEVDVIALRADQLSLRDVLALFAGPDGNWHQGYRSLQLDGIRAAPDLQLTDLLRPLGTHLVAPLAAALRQRQLKSVCLIPCGPLGLFPLHTASFPTGDILGALGASPEGCLIDQFEVTFAPSARALSAAGSAAALSAQPNQPAYFVGVSDPRGESEAGTLPWARAEVEVISGLLPAYTTRIILSGAAATREAVVTASAHATHLHLACHGRYDAGAPLHSHLSLADAPLELGELLDSPVFSGARLVVMSACQSALTELGDLTDEVVSLPGALLEAGAAASIGTLWPVSDAAAALLIVRFYELLLSDSHNTEVSKEAIKPGGVCVEIGALRPRVVQHRGNDLAKALAAAQRWLRDQDLKSLQLLRIVIRQCLS